MSDNPNKEVIEKLERLHFLIQETFKWDDYIQSGYLLEYGDKIEKVVLSASDLDAVPAVFHSFPVFPIDGAKREEAKRNYNNKKKILAFLAVLSAICLVVFFMTHKYFFNSIASVGILATIIFFFPFSQSKKVYKDKDKEYNASVKKSEESFVAYRKALRLYENQKAAGIEAAKAFAQKYTAAYDAYDGLMLEMEERKNDAITKLLACMEETKAIDFVPVEYYDLVQPMIAMLKSGRADSYKEALNLAIQEQRLKEAEDARRAEEARRTQLMQEQAAAEQMRLAEMERHNREMEQQQQLQAKMMLEEQQKQARDAKKAQEKAQSAQFHADVDAHYRALHRCAKCRKASACGANKGIPNCGAFEPR